MPLAQERAAGIGGDQISVPIPCCRQVGRISASMLRARSEYWDCELMRGVPPDRWAAHWDSTICAAVKLEQPT